MSEDKLQLSTAALSIHNKLRQIIRDKITANGGVISFSEFTQMALYQSQLGYYQNNLKTFGADGDFITAPEMGSCFANSLARAISASTKDSSLLEIGAGSGALALNMMKFFEGIENFPTNYSILEPSARLQAQQKETTLQLTTALAGRFKWLQSLPENFNGTIVANEVMDAIPFERIQKAADGWYHLGVGIGSNDEDFCWQLMDKVKSDDLPQALKNGCDYIEGYTTEIRPLIKPWVASLAASLEQGNMLLFDYGYPQKDLYHPQRVSGSLRCYSRHQANDDALSLVGLQDISAHVDFTQVAHAAYDSGFEINGFTTQAGFLLENGVLDNHAEKAQTSSHQTYALSRELQLLTAPGQMGEAVKVIWLNKKSESKISGFKLQDHLYRL